MATEDQDPNRSEATNHFANQLYRRVWETARLRVGLEERWWNNTLQYHGQYDEETEKKLRENKGSSKLYVNMTRPKTRVLRARLIDILFPTDEANWDIEPTPVPRIQRALARTEGSENLPLQQEETNRANQEMQTAKERAKNMRALMRDQLIETDYLDVGRQQLTQACRLGAGVSKGPFSMNRMKRRWARNGKKGSWGMQKQADDRAMFQFVNLWDFYPDMDASSMKDCEFVFQLHRMSMSEMKKLGRTGVFNADNVRFLVEQTAGYAPTDAGHFNENLRYVRQLENELDDTAQNRYNVFEYYGNVGYEDFKALCDEFNSKDLFEKFGKGNDRDPLFEIPIVVWFCADQVLRFTINPLESGELPYSVFRLDPTENTLIGGAGIPQMLRDPQSSLNAAWRIVMESAGLDGVPMYQIDKTRVDPENGVWEITPRKIWVAKGGFGQEAGGPPIVPVVINGSIESLIAVAKQSRMWMDDEANLPLIAQGDPGTGAKQTAHGMTLLANAVNVLFRDAARGYDAEVTIPSMGRLYEWNMLFSKDDDVKGDMEIKALGSSVLLINEIVSQNLLMLVNLYISHPEEFGFLRFHELVRLWFRMSRLDRYSLMMTDEEFAKLQQEKAAEPPPVDPMLEGKKELAQMQIEAQQGLKGIDRDVALMTLAAKREMSVEQIEAELKKARMEVEAKERAMVAEVGVKERHGEGI